MRTITTTLGDISLGQTVNQEVLDIDLSDYYIKSETSSASELDIAFNDLSNYYYEKSETSSASELSNAFNTAEQWDNLSLSTTTNTIVMPIEFYLSAFGIDEGKGLKSITFTVQKEGFSGMLRSAIFKVVDSTYQFITDLSNAIAVSNPVQISANTQASGNPQTPYDAAFTFNWGPTNGQAIDYTSKYCLAWFKPDNSYHALSFSQHRAAEANPPLHAIMTNEKVIPRITVTRFTIGTPDVLNVMSLRGKQYKIGSSTEWMKNALLDVIYAMGGTAVDEPAAVS